MAPGTSPHPGTAGCNAEFGGGGQAPGDMGNRWTWGRWGSGDPQGHRDQRDTGEDLWGQWGMDGHGRDGAQGTPSDTGARETWGWPGLGVPWGGTALHLGVGAAVGDILGVSPLGAPGPRFLEHLLGTLGDPGLTLLQAPVTCGPAGGTQAGQPPPGFSAPGSGRRGPVALTAPCPARPGAPRPALVSPPAWGMAAPCAGTSAASGSAGTREGLGSWHGLYGAGTRGHREGTELGQSGMG